MVAPALQCSPLPASVDDEQGAMRIVNPYTAWAHLRIAQQVGAHAIVQTAAASSLGQMVNRLARRHGVTVINIVRRDAQAEMLRAAGAAQILNSESPDFDTALRDLCRRLNARLAFDAVSGAMTARLLEAMPPEARVVVYGGLAGELISVNPGELIFNQRRVEGFYLARWISHQNRLSLLAMQRQLYSLGDLTHATIQRRAPMEDAQKAIAAYEANMSAGKVLLMPSMSGTQAAPLTAER
jgi:NADPH:quinone reductase-like Zn-dependent oxidoreductase